MKRIILFSTALLLLSGFHGRAHEAADDMATAAQVWLASLSEEQKEAATFELTTPAREDWHFIPKPFEGEGVRKGVTLKSMGPDQRHLAYGLLSTGLSHRGMLTATQIMSLEQVLWEMENNDPKRDTQMYYVSIYGDPASGDWAWAFEGHHLSLNFTVAGGKVASVTPNFFASNPGIIHEGPRKGLKVLAVEEDIARELVKSLSEAQRGTAVIEDKAPRDILTSAEPTVEHLGDAGISYGDLTKDQQAKLLELIDVYVKRVRAEVAAEEMEKIKSEGLDKIVFAWAGGFEPKQGHYYRVQGPTFLLEYANTQNGAEHVHAVWRDFDGDFGRDVLKEHYQAHHKAK